MKRSLIAAALLLASVMLLTGCTVSLSAVMNYDDRGYEKAQENEVIKFDDTVRRLEIEWLSGKIEIVKGEEFSVCEKSIRGEYVPLYYKLESGTLYIKHSANGTSMTFLNNKDKQLTVTVTDQVGALLMNSVSADFSVGMYSADKIDIKNVSGKGAVKADTVKEFKYDAVSGDISLEAEITAGVDINTVSALTAIVQKKADAANEFKLNTVSGGVTITFPSDLAGHTVKVKSVSGGFTSEFGDGVYGDGSVSIDLNSVSADLLIKKAE